MLIPGRSLGIHQETVYRGCLTQLVGTWPGYDYKRQRTPASNLSGWFSPLYGGGGRRFMACKTELNTLTPGRFKYAESNHGRLPWRVHSREPTHLVQMPLLLGGLAPCVVGRVHPRLRECNDLPGCYVL